MSLNVLFVSRLLLIILGTITTNISLRNGLCYLMLQTQKCWNERRTLHPQKPAHAEGATWKHRCLIRWCLMHVTTHRHHFVYIAPPNRSESRMQTHPLWFHLQSVSACVTTAATLARPWEHYWRRAPGPPDSIALAVVCQTKHRTTS